MANKKAQLHQPIELDDEEEEAQRPSLISEEDRYGQISSSEDEDKPKKRVCRDRSSQNPSHKSKTKTKNEVQDNQKQIITQVNEDLLKLPFDPKQFKIQSETFSPQWFQPLPETTKGSTASQPEKPKEGIVKFPPHILNMKGPPARERDYPFRQPKAKLLPQDAPPTNPVERWLKTGSWYENSDEEEEARKEEEKEYDPEKEKEIREREKELLKKYEAKHPHKQPNPIGPIPSRRADNEEDSSGGDEEPNFGDIRF